MKTYDYIIIGAASSLSIVQALEEKKIKVALIEEGPFGGTCLNRGCIPSKMLIAHGDFYRALDKEREFHVKAGQKEIDFLSIIKEVKKIISDEAKKLFLYYKNSSYVDLYSGHCKFVDCSTIEVNGKLLKGKKFILNVGGSPRIPPIAGLKDTPFITSDDILNLKARPKKMVILGTGYIGVEYGFFFGAIKTDVHLIGKGKVLEGEDKDIRDEFKKGFGQFCTSHEDCSITKVTYKNKIFSIHYIQNKKRKKIFCDTLLVATGREPNTKDLGLENTKIKLLKNGLIKVDKYLETTQRAAFALGDCIEGYFLKHTANFESDYLKDYLLGKKEKIAYPEIPYAIFSYPEIASVGKKEKDLSISYFLGKAKYSDVARGITLKEKLGFVKLIFEKKTKRLIGAQIVGEEASVLIHVLIALMSKKCKLDDLLGFLYIHPSLPEIIKRCAEDAKMKDVD